MVNGRAIVESSTADGVMEAILCLEQQFHNVTSTIPVMTYDGRYISSVHYSNETTSKEKTK